MKGRYEQMSMRIKLSYTDDQELHKIMQLLSPVVKSWKKQPSKGKYKRVYIDLNRERSPNEAREGADS